MNPIAAGQTFTPDLFDKVRKQIVRACSEFQLIHEGDRIMVCVSGGKDSSVLLWMLQAIQKKSPYTFHIEAVMLDQGQPGFLPKPFVNWVQGLGIPLKVISRDTYSIVKEKVTDGIYCALCSRLRRGILYDYAADNKFSKMALGHHREDLNETLLLNLFYTGKISSMPVKLKSDDQRNTIIRPLAYVAEEDLAKLAQILAVPILPCNLCGSQENLNRKKIKRLIQDLKQGNPIIQNSLLAAQGNVKPSQLLDQNLWDFSF